MTVRVREKCKGAVTEEERKVNKKKTILKRKGREEVWDMGKCGDSYRRRRDD